jgi:hypothetical protein
VLVGDALRAFLARILGSNERAVELALRSLTLALDQRTTLMLYGDGDMVPIAWALHVRTLGPDSPFVVCDPRRRPRAASVCSPESYPSGVAVFEAAVGGSLCVHMRRLPGDVPALVARLQRGDDVRCAICIGPLSDSNRPPIRPAPLIVPPLARRSADLDQIIWEYADEARAGLGASEPSFTDVDRAWVRDHAATSLAEIEEATRRLVALRIWHEVPLAAARLGMAPASLSRWFGRRGVRRAADLPPHVRRATVSPPSPPTLAEIWERRVLDMLEEPQREGLAPPFAFGDANIRIAAEEWLERIKSGSAPRDQEAIAGLKALLADLDVRLGPSASPRSDKPKQ